MTRFKFIFEHFKKYRFIFISSVLASIIYAILGLLTSLIFSFVIDNLIQGLPVTNPFLSFFSELLGGVDYLSHNIWVVAIVLIIMYAIHALMMFYRYNGQAIFSEGLSLNIRNDLYDHLQKLPYAYHVRAKTGDLVQRCTSDVDTIRRFFAGQCLEIVVIIVSAISALYILFSININMALIASISLPIIFIYSYIFFCKVRKQFTLSDEAEGVMTTKIQESLSGVRVIKAFHRERYELDKFLTLSKNYQDVTYKMLSYLGWFWASSYLICLLGILSVIVFGVFSVQNNSLTIGNFTVFVTYQTTILYQLRQLGRILSDFGRLTVSLDRLIEIKNEKIEDLEDGLYPSLDGSIDFDHVSFHYDDDPDTEILKDINLHINKGDTVAIIGPTGSGKSSLIQLLDRLYEPTDGSISINGVDISSIAKKHLRKNIGIVLQEPFLFSKTIYENLRVSNANIDFRRIKEATSIACVHDVINEFEKGYDTIVGEKGITLSGGQKQRIAIARTLVNDCEILVFDDSLSAVDAQTDVNIRKALKTLEGDVTMLIITQRVLTAKDADYIVVMENGTITQVGKHEDLIKTDGFYSRINEIQNSIKEETINVN